MANIARLKDAETENGNVIDADDLDAEFDQIISAFNTNDTTLTNVTTGTYTFSGVKTFSSTPKMNAIDERTAATGVTIDSVLCKDGFIRVPAGAGFTPTTNGDLGYDSTSHTYDVYVNGAAKSLLHTGSSIDDLNDVTISGAASGQGLTYNGSAWVNGTVGSLILITTATASASTSIDFTSGISSTYDVYELHFSGLTVSASSDLWLRVSEDAGSNWPSDASDYYFAQSQNGGAPTTSTGAQIELTSDPMVTSFTNMPANGVIRFYKPASTSLFKVFEGNFWIPNGAATVLSLQSFGAYAATAAITGVRFMPSGGNNFATGSFALYGVKKS